MKINDLTVMGILSDQKVTRVMYASIPIERTKECKIFPVSNILFLRLENYDPMHHRWTNRV
jgi:hypothetical protein